MLIDANENKENNVPTIIFQNDDFVMVNKPTGITMHAHDSSKEGTLLDTLFILFPESASIENTMSLDNGESIALGGIVHRLDRDTSGIILYAKHNASFLYFQKAFLEHTIDKEYTALLSSILPVEQMIIDKPLMRVKKSFRRTTDQNIGRGPKMEAYTSVFVQKAFENTTLVTLIPKTGRTHQLRVHMESIGHPIVGDVIYGRKDGDEHVTDTRLMLHASKLSFMYKGEQYSFESEMKW